MSGWSEGVVGASSSVVGVGCGGAGRLPTARVAGSDEMLPQMTTPSGVILTVDARMVKESSGLIAAIAMSVSLERSASGGGRHASMGATSA